MDPCSVIPFTVSWYNLEQTFEMAMAAKAATEAVFGQTVEWPQPSDLRDGVLLERLRVLSGDYRPRRKFSEALSHQVDTQGSRQTSAASETLRSPSPKDGASSPEIMTADGQEYLGKVSKEHDDSSDLEMLGSWENLHISAYMNSSSCHMVCTSLAHWCDA